MNPDFSSNTSAQKTNNYYKYNQQAYAGYPAQNSYGLQAGTYPGYPNYYDQYSAYGYQQYYNQNLSNQYVYPYSNYQTSQVPGYDQNAQYQQLLLQSLAGGQQTYPQATTPQAVAQTTDLTAQYQAQAAGYPGVYGYDYSQFNMYGINPQAQMPMPQVNTMGTEADLKKANDEKK